MLEKPTKYLHRCVENVRRFRRAERGATAVEFALIAPAFIATLVALLQTCLFLFAQMALQNAAVQASRYFMTGQAQNGGWTASTVTNMVCPEYLFTCSKLILIVQNYSSFAAANTSAPQLYNNGQLITSWAYDPGTPGEVMVVQLVYPWTVVGGPLGFTLANIPNSGAEMMGVSAFRVEPY
jgi:Flp pilus assembly pilin Flp